MRRRVVSLSVGLAMLHAGGAYATLIFQDFARSVSVEFRDRDGNIVASDGESEGLPPGGVFTQPLDAFIGGDGFQGSVGMDVSGFFGLQGFQRVPGALTAAVSIAVLVTNDFPNPVDVPFDFIINEGLFNLTAAEGSTLGYELLVNTVGFTSTGTLRSTSDPSLFASFSTTGDSIGAVFDGEYEVEVPFSVNGVTETLDPGDSRFFTYDLFITSNVVGFAEISFFQFRDPAQLGNLPPDATQFGPSITSATVDEPPPLPALAAWLLGLTAFRRLRRRGCEALPLERAILARSRTSS